MQCKVVSESWNYWHQGVKSFAQVVLTTWLGLCKQFLGCRVSCLPKFSIFSAKYRLFWVRMTICTPLDVENLKLSSDHQKNQKNLSEGRIHFLFNYSFFIIKRGSKSFYITHTSHSYTFSLEFSIVNNVVKWDLFALFFSKV